MTYPIDLSSAIDNVTEIVAAHLNNLEVKVGIDGSAVNTTIDYLLKSASSTDPGHKHPQAKITGLTTGDSPIFGTVYLSNVGDGHVPYQNNGAAGLVAGSIHTDGLNVFINDTQNANMTCGLTINQGANDDQIFALKSSDITHTVTTDAEADTYGYISKYSATLGGVLFRGLTDGDAAGAMVVEGIIGATDPTDTNAALILIGSKQAGTTTAALGEAETVFQLKNRTTNLVTVLGRGNVGIGMSPVAQLDVKGSAALGQIRLQHITQTGYDRLTLYSSADDSFDLYHFDAGYGSATYNGKSFFHQTQGGVIYGYVMTFDQGNVGIGISPVVRLDVYNTYASDTGVQVKFRDTIGTSLNFGGTSAGVKWLQAQDTGSASTYHMSLQPLGGNVGIGTTETPRKVVIITGQDDYVDIANVTDTSGKSTGIIFGNYSISDGYRKGGIFYKSSGDGYSRGDLILAVRTTLDINNATAADAKLTILGTNGNVGIGTTVPQQALHVVGTILVDGDGGGYAGTTGFTDIVDIAARSTGVGTVLFDDATNRNSAGFIKIYIGTVPYYLACFAVIT